MYCWCRRVVAATLVLLPAVESFVVPGTCCRDTCFSTHSEAVPRWTAAISSIGRPRGLPRREDELLIFRRADLRMQGGAGYGGAGEGQQMPGGDGYSSNLSGSKPAWNPQRSFSDGFHEGIPRLNTVFLTGYLGQDPKPKYFDSGRVVLNLSLAVKREYHPIERKALGVQYGEEETDWFQLEMWNRDAEYAAKVCKKGGRIGVTGSLSLNAWVDREGRDRTTTKILVQNLELLDSRAEQAERSDQSDANLWESERLQKSDAAALRQQGGASAPASGGGVAGGGAYQPSPEDLETKARKKAAEDKWWSAEPEGPSNAMGASAGDSTTAGRSRESSWWEEEEDVAGREGGTGSKGIGIDADELPSFFDN